ncbi:MAG: hypothetical protein INR69_07735 [Mucilaginibacter polytrichastri]|nr:hypothetical protein [Mucilaginibacter polytrichastri]
MKILHIDNPVQERWKDLHCRMSFGPYLQFFRERRENDHTARRNIYDYIISSFEAHPELLEPFNDIEMLNQYPQLIELLQMSLLPVAGTYDHDPIAFGSIFPTQFFYYTDAFRTLLEHESAGQAARETTDDLTAIRIFYGLILEKCYGLKPDFINQKIVRLDDPKKHTVKFYKIETDTRFIDVQPAGDLPPKNDDWANMLCGSNKEFLRLTEELPASLFRISGFTIFYGQDITGEEALNRLKNSILDLHNSSEKAALDQIESTLGILLGNTGIKMGVAPFFKVNDEVVTDTSYLEKTILISTLDQCPNDKINPQTAAEKFAETPGPIIFPVINKEIIAEHPVLKGLAFLHVGSYMVMPVRGTGGEILGALELATEEENGISRNLATRLEPALNLIADLLEFMISRFQEKVRTVIKERFTPLQPSVEWKFNEAAWQFVRSKSTDENRLPNVVFEDVFPLYGAVDIKNSSVERNKAAQSDMIRQLEQTVELFPALQESGHDTGELAARNKLLLNDIRTHYSAENEQRIRDFLSLSLYPLLRNIAGSGKSGSGKIGRYFEQTDVRTGAFMASGRAYEDSLQKLNKTINRYLESERVYQNEQFPHYFEKYRTDGVEYTLYTGQSLDPKQKFDTGYLKKLHIWQLRTMARIGYLTRQVACELEIPLETTQLVLAHNQPITISFRKDERRFDVEGSYNIRYEVMKKRIDKIEVLGTGERLTRPGHVAIVYTHTPEGNEYRHHLDLLTEKGIFLPGYEHLELEDMQGVSGLRAFRAAINYAYFSKHETGSEAETETYIG